VSFASRDDPSPEFIESMRRQYPTEREVDALLVRKLKRRSGPEYHRPSLDELSVRVRCMLDDLAIGEYTISDERWFSGGVSKIQMGFILQWHDPDRGPSKDRLVVRMDPSESHNATSRLREAELLRALGAVIPVPKVYWLDRDARWFPEPALIYEFVDGVTKPRNATTGRVTGLGTNFGPELREILAPQFINHLARIHTFDHSGAQLGSFDPPRVGSTEGPLRQLNRARRTWEEDRGEDYPLMEVAANWLERNLPPVDQVSVVHGDYRSGNFLFNEADGRVTAWLDWERGHLGDRHRDLAWTTQHTFGHFSEDGKTYFVCGLVPLEKFYDRYAEASGLVVDQRRLTYYRIENCYSIIVALFATAYRVSRLGKTHQDVLLARMEGMVPAVAHELYGLLRDEL
jgi:aminoglycoside phosphotransferase (APT) family kinase protein